MTDKQPYEKLIKLLLKHNLTLNELRALVDNEFVQGVNASGGGDRDAKFIKYSVKLSDGDIYYVYVKS